MAYVKVNNLDFFYEIEGDGEPLILINGIYGSTQIWGYTKNVLKSRYKVITYDCRDQGKTSLPSSDYTFYQHVEDLKELLSALSIKKVSLAGLSQGACIAMHFAADFPDMVEKLVLISPISEKSPIDHYYYNYMERFLKDHSLNEYYKHMIPYLVCEDYCQKLMPSITGEQLLFFVEKLASDFAARFEGSNSPQRLLSAINSDTFESTPKLKNIKCPAIIIVGDKDRFTPLSRSQIINDSITGSKLFIIPNCGHSVHLEKTKFMTGLMYEFLTEKPFQIFDNIEEVRDEIDLIDKLIIQYLSQRHKLVTQAAFFKKDISEVGDKKRVENVINKVKELSQKAGLNPDIAEKTYQTLINALIEHEKDTFSKLKE